MRHLRVEIYLSVSILQFYRRLAKTKPVVFLSWYWQRCSTGLRSRNIIGLRLIRHCLLRDLQDGEVSSK